jgi:hypothetical protein
MTVFLVLPSKNNFPRASFYRQVQKYLNESYPLLTGGQFNFIIPGSSGELVDFKGGNPKTKPTNIFFSLPHYLSVPLCSHDNGFAHYR